MKVLLSSLPSTIVAIVVIVPVVVLIIVVVLIVPIVLDEVAVVVGPSSSTCGDRF